LGWFKFVDFKLQALRLDAKYRDRDVRFLDKDDSATGNDGTILRIVGVEHSAARDKEGLSIIFRAKFPKAKEKQTGSSSGTRPTGLSTLLSQRT